MHFKNKHVKKISGTILLTVSSLIVLSNFVFAHYRLISSTQTTTMVQNIIESIKQGPFTIFYDVPSLVLFFMGIIFAFFAGLKGYRWDDPYPGYGRIYKSWEDTKKLVLNKEHNIRTQCENIIKKTVEELKKSRNRIEKELQTPNSLIDICTQESKQYERFASSIDSKQSQLISIYRDTNTDRRDSKKVPEYFKTEVHIEHDNTILECDIDKIHEEIKTREMNGQKNIQEIDRAIETIINSRQHIMTEINDYFIEMTADNGNPFAEYDDDFESLRDNADAGESDVPR